MNPPSGPLPRNRALFRPHKLWPYLRKLIVEGAICLETPFSHQPRDGGEIYQASFLTSIHLDGNILNFLPDPEKFPNDPEWRAVFSAAAETHQQRVSRVWRELAGLGWLGERAAVGAGVFFGCLGLMLGDYHSGAPDWWQALLEHFGMLALGGLLGGLIFGKILRPLLVYLVKYRLEILLAPRKKS